MKVLSRVAVASSFRLVPQPVAVNPAMADLKHLAAESLSGALAAIDRLWTADENAA